MAAERTRILADEQVLVARQAWHGIAGTHAFQAFIGGDPDQINQEAASRNRVPGSVERRVEVDRVVRQLDVSDFHFWVRSVAATCRVSRGADSTAEQ